MTRPSRLPIDSPIPPSGLRRVAVVVALVVGGLVALLVPVVFVVMLLGLIRGP